MAPNYGEESRDPKRIVPRALYISVIGLGIFYTLTSWASLGGYSSVHAAVAQAQTNPAEFYLGPARQYAGHWVSSIMSYLIITGSFACGMAFHNTTARHFYSLGREGLMPAPLGRTHHRWKSPHIASLTQSVIAAFIIGLFIELQLRLLARPDRPRGCARRGGGRVLLPAAPPGQVRGGGQAHQRRALTRQRRVQAQVCATLVGGPVRPAHRGRDTPARIAIGPHGRGPRTRSARPNRIYLQGMKGVDILGRPMLNKDTAFTRQERGALGLAGHFPWRTATLEQQVTLEMEHLRRKPDPLERYIGLAALQDRNETLFYRVLVDNIEELAPIVYTPTVGDACSQFSHIVRRPRGIWITPDDVDHIPELLASIGRPGVRLIVATDNERILGLGDQGVGGMGIPVGKLALYCAGAGIHPSLTLPVSLDCGTDNPDLLNDPLYLGYPGKRLRGADYDAFIEKFVDAVARTWPEAVLQWEDFKQHNAIRLLGRYRDRLPCFNDDIQGTAAVVTAGILAALRVRDEPLASQRLLLLGAGAAGTGIAALVRQAAAGQAAGQDGHVPTVVMLDSKGLIFDGRDNVDEDKRPFALSADQLAQFGFAPASRYDLENVISHIAPTILIGTSGTPGSFTEKAIREMAARTPAPIVFPLSNPTAKSEATPADVLAWTEGRALVATGSPFDPVHIHGRTYLVGQANNVFVFPGIGLGAIVAGATEITDRMFLVAATTLAGMVAAERLSQGALYPPLGDLREASRKIAIAVAREARRSGVSRMNDHTEVENAVDAAMWTPGYEELKL